MFTPPPSPLYPQAHDLPTHLPPPLSDTSTLLMPDQMDYLKSKPLPLLPAPKSASDDRVARKERTRLTLVVLAVVSLLLAFLVFCCRDPGFLSLSPSHRSAGSIEDSNLSHARWRPHHSRVHWRKRATVNSGSLDASSTPPSSSASPSPSVTPTSTQVPTVPDTPPVLPTPFLQPFDVALSFNFSTTGCAAFFTNLTLSANFRGCRSFGMLMSSSGAFFQAQNNLTLLNNVIWGTCNTKTSENDCIANMAWNVNELKTVCAADLKDRNSLAVEALNGFLSYEESRQAGCLVDPTTNTYCYVDAVASSSPSDLYYYSLSLGTPLPNNTVPSCSACTKSLLELYANYASNKSLPISQTYNAAASAANDQCGSLYAPVLASSSTSLRPSYTLAFGMLAGLVSAVVTLAP